jgi:hypothetical protein
LFIGSFIEALLSDNDDYHYAIRQDLLIGEFTTLPCFGNGSNVGVNIDIRVLGQKCLNRAKIKQLTFEPESGPLRIEKKYFSNSTLKSVNVPRLVEFFGKSCFLNTDIEAFTFEPNSGLKRIKES